MKFRFLFLALLCALGRRVSCEKRGRLSQALLGSIGSVASGATDFISTAGQKSKNLLANATRATTGVVDNASSKGLESKLKAFLEKFRERMKNGFPEIGIPSFEPFLVEEFEMLVDNPNIGNVTFYAWDTSVHNLSTFIIDRAKLSLIGPTITFNLTIPEMYATGQYNISGIISDIFPIQGAGVYEASVYDIKIYISSSFGYNKGMYMKSFDADFSFGAIKLHLNDFMGGEKISDIMHQVFEELAPVEIEALKYDFLPQFKESVGNRVNVTMKHLTMKDVINLLIGDTDGQHMQELDTAKDPTRLKLSF